MSQNEDDNKQNEMEWKKSPLWSEILNYYNDDEEDEEEENKNPSVKKPVVYQNNKLIRLIKENYNLSSLSPIEKLLSLEQKISSSNEDIDNNSLKLIEFKKYEINRLKEDILFYCASPKLLLNYKKDKTKEKLYEFYKDLEIENFMVYQKERNDIIHKYIDKEDNSLKQNLLNQNFDIDIIYPEKNSKNNIIMKKLYLLSQKLSNYNLLELKEIDNNKLLDNLKEVKDMVKDVNKINPYSCGITLYNFIVKYFISIFDMISYKFNDNKNNLIELFFILQEICYYISSIPLKFYLLKTLKNNINIFMDNDKDIYFNDNYIFMENYLNFNDINSKENFNLTFIDFKTFLDNEDYEEKIDNVNNLSLYNYWTLNSKNNLYLFFQNPYKIKKCEEIQFLIYFQIDLELNKIINNGNITLINEENSKTEKIIDINISIKKEAIYLVYIIKNIKNGEKYYMKYKIYNTDMISIYNNNDEKNIIEFSSFIPTKLINDSKYLYCFSTTQKIFIVKRNYNFNEFKYATCTFNFQNFKMHNTFCINNYLIIENIIENKKYSAIINKYSEEKYTLEIFEIKSEQQVKNNLENNIILNITFNDNRYVVTKLYIDYFDLYFSVIENNEQNKNFIFSFSECYLNYTIDNYFDKYIKEFCFLLNMCCNNSNNQSNLIISSIFNFSQSNLKYIIQNIIENQEYDKIKLYYIIILKAIIRNHIQLNKLNELELKSIITILKQIIINAFLEKEKHIYYKILKEIIIISSYIKNINIIELNDIKFIISNENKDIKTQLLLLQLLLEQEKTNKDINIYKIIIDIEFNFIKQLFNNIKNNKTISKLIKNYYLMNKTMKNAADILYKISYDQKIFTFNIMQDLFLNISKYINEICELYKNIINNNNSYIINYSFLYNSFLFRAFYFIMQKIIACKFYINNNNIILSLYKNILLLDKLNINDISYDFYDLENIIEIKSSFFLNTNENGYQNEYGNNYFEKITLKEPKNIVIKTSLTSHNNINDYFRLELYKDKDQSYIVNLNFETGKIFKKVSKIEITMKNRDSIFLKDFVLNIIPLKNDFNEKEYYIQKNSKDHRIILLIEKSIIHYLLFLFEDIYAQIDDFNNDKIIYQFSKIYKSDIFKFININNIKVSNKKDISSNPVIDKINQLIKKIGNTLGYNEINFKILNQNLMNSFEDINKDINKTINYEEQIIKINKIIKTEELPKNKKYEILDMNKYDRIFNLFQNDIKNKNRIFCQRQNSQILDNIIKKIFFISIKYFDCLIKLDNLLKNVDKSNDKVENLDYYNLFYSIYEESSKIIILYYEKSNEFDDKETLDEMLAKFTNIIDFLYDIIFPSDDSNIEPNSSIAKCVINLISRKNIEIEEIKKYSEIQNMICYIKYIELMIISNLLNSLQNETNIAFLLQLISGKIRKSNNISNTFFDTILGADYLMLEKLKYQFHLLLSYLSDKLLQNKYCMTTEILFIENLIWKVRGRNFPILNQILKVFEDLKTFNNKNDEDIFKFQHICIYNFKYFNKYKKYKIKFEVFKIIVEQILEKNKFENKENSDILDLSLTRNISKISSVEYNNIFNVILSYFTDIKTDNIFYHEFILFFYKSFINSDNILNYLKNQFVGQKVINKIINVALNKEENNLKIDDNIDAEETKQLTQLIMTKLFFKIIESNDDIYNLNYLLSENNEENAYISLLKIILNKLNEIQEENILKKYYIKIFILCLNKLMEYRDGYEVEEFIKNNLNNFSNIILLLSDGISWLIEDKFIINKDIDSNFSELALFDSKGNQLQIHGEIISFFDSISKDSFSKYFSNSNLAYFDKNDFKFFLINTEQKYEYAFVYTEEYYDLDSFNVSNIEMISIKNITIIKMDDDYLQKKFIENYKDVILKILFDELNNNKLNEKGIYYLFIIISKLMHILSEEEKTKIFEYIWKFYVVHKKEEDESQFLSLEFIENIINMHINLLCPKNKNIEKEIKDENLIKEFIYKIQNYDFYLELKNSNIKLKFGNSLCNPIFEKNKDEEISKIYDINYSLNYLYFYKYNEIYTDDIIENKSILITDSIRSTQMILELSELIEKNNNKIKIIFMTNLNFNNDFNIELTKFIKNKRIPIFIIESNLSKIIYEYFIEGKIDIFTYTKKKITNKSKTYYDSLFNYKEENIIKENVEEKEDNKIGEKSDKDDEIIMNIDSLFKVEKKIVIKKFEKEKKDIYENLINKPIKFFKLGAIKLSKRLIYDLICSKNNILSEKNGDIENIVNIFNYLCLEYYFNINIIIQNIDFFNIDNYLLKQKLNEYLLFLSSKKSDESNKNEWLLKYFDYLKECLLFSQSTEKYSSLGFTDYLSKYNISNKFTTFSFNKILFSDQDIEFDVFLFFSKNCLDNKDFPIKMFLELIEIKIEYLLKVKFNLSIYTNLRYNQSYNIVIKINNDSEISYMFEIMNNCYEYFINNIDKKGFEKFKEIFISSQIHNLMKSLIDEKVDLLKYFYNENEEGELRYSKMRRQNISLAIEYTFKYFDFCLLIYLRQEDKLNLFEYWINSKKEIFTFFCNYKFLSIDKNIEIYNNKEMYSFLFYLNNIYNNKDKFIHININDIKYELAMNKMNIYRNKDNISNNIKFSIISSIVDLISYKINEFYNLIILYYNKKIKNFSIIDIINIHNFGGNDDIKIKIGNEIYEIFLYPTGKLIPIIYAYNQANDNINKNNIPLQLNKKIYSDREFYIENYFNEAFNINNNGEAFYASKDNKQKYVWLDYVTNNNENNIKIQFDYKISCLYADYKNCFLIDITGNLYGLGDNTYNQITNEKINNIKVWTKIPLPENCKSFIKCITGKDYLLCLIKEKDGKNYLYVRGNNDKCQCGISGINYITDLTKCQFNDNIEIKDIFANEYFSSAITIDGKLYIWGTIIINSNFDKSLFKGKTIKIPTLVKSDDNDDIIFEHMSINPKNKNTQLFIIGKSSNDFNKKCFNLDIYNEEFILKEIIPWNTKNIPLKVYTNDEDEYNYILYFDENKFIHEINNNNNFLYDLYYYYKSNDLNMFIQEVNSITDKDISLFVEIIEQIKEDSKKEKIIENIILEEFITYIKDKKDKKYYKLFKLFGKNKNYLFNYLKYRYLINSKYYMKYYYTNLLSTYKKLLQPLITKNSIFLTSEARMKIFLSRLNMDRNTTSYRINVDRIKANLFIEKFNENFKKEIDKELNITIFGQVFHSLEKIKSQNFFLEKNKRLFRVNLIGENAIDEGGPYHDIISEMCKDLQSEYLDLFIKTPNNKNNLGDLRDRYIINPDATKNIHKKAYEFIGKLMVLSISSGELLNINLHPIIFKLILNNEISFSDFETIDYNSFKLIKDLNEALNKKNIKFINQMGLNFEIKNSNGSDLELIPGGKDIYVNIDNLNEYINLYKIKRLEEFNIQIKEIQKGLFAGISFDSLQILNWRQFEQLICGKNIFDIQNFKEHTNYDGYNKDDQVIKWFWEWLENISEEDKYKYLRFVSGRTRLPQTNLGYNYTHTINKRSNQDLYPTSHTCFFTLHLPNYNNKDNLNKKMDYVIENSVLIADP